LYNHLSFINATKIVEQNNTTLRNQLKVNKVPELLAIQKYPVMQHCLRVATINITKERFVVPIIWTQTDVCARKIYVCIVSDHDMSSKPVARAACLPPCQYSGSHII
jgi:hypothetical protein